MPCNPSHRYRCLHGHPEKWAICESEAESSTLPRSQRMSGASWSLTTVTNKDISSRPVTTCHATVHFAWANNNNINQRSIARNSSYMNCWDSKGQNLRTKAGSSGERIRWEKAPTASLFAPLTITFARHVLYFSSCLAFLLSVFTSH